jgi:hypothetical protein
MLQKNRLISEKKFYICNRLKNMFGNIVVICNTKIEPNY